MIDQDKIRYTDFAQKIKQKYPDYAEVDDLVLAKKMIEKYPEYGESVYFEEIESPKKKDDTESILKDGFSASVETVEEKPLEDVLIESSFEDRDKKVGYIGNLVSSLDKGLYKNLIGNPVKGLGLTLEGITGPGFASDALINFANYYNNAIDELTPQDEEFRGTLSDQFGQAFGQVAALTGTGFLTGAGKAGQILQMAKAPTTINIAKETGKQLLNPVAVSGGMSMGASEFERAKESGATDDQAFEAFYKNAAVGSVLERIPMMQFFKRFNSATKGGVVNYLKTKGTAGVVGGTEEMITEVLQTIYANKTAKDIYNETQDLLEGVGESGGVGFGVGFILNALGARARLAKSEGNTSEAAAIEQAVRDFEQKNEERIRDEEIENGVKDEVRKGDPNLSDAQVDKIAPLQRELNNLESNNTEVAKLKKKQLREQIDQIINQGKDAVQERETEEVPMGEQTPVGEEVVEEVREQAAEEQDVQAEEIAEEVVDQEITEAEVKEEDNVENIEGYDRMQSELDGVIEKSKKRDKNPAKVLSNAMSYLQGSAVYERANDVQREKMVRDLRLKMGIKEKKASSTPKLTGEKREKKMVDIKAALKDQLRLEAKAATGRKKAQKGLLNKVEEMFKPLVKKGEVGVRQLKGIIGQFKRIDIDNPTSVFNFMRKAEKMLNDADYQSKLKTARESVKSIKRYSKIKDTQATDSAIAKEFLKIDPSKVEDIDLYNKMAAKVKSMTAPGKAKDFKAQVQGTESHAELTSYIEDAKKQNESVAKERKMQINQDLVDAGVIDESMSNEDIDAIVNAIEDDPDSTTDDRERYVAAYINKIKDAFIPIMERIAETGKDPFTGESYDFSSEEIDLIKRFAKIDFEGLKRSEQLRAIKAMSNIQENGVFDGVIPLIEKSEGNSAGKKFGKENKAKEFALLGETKAEMSNAAIKLYGKDVMTIPLFVQNLYKGIDRANKFFKESGFSDIIRGRRGAIVYTKDAIKRFKKKFTQDFSREQIAEMTMFSFLNRTMPTDRQAEFNRRKKILQEDIEAKKKSDDKNDQEIGSIMEQIYNERYAEANSVEDLKPNSEVKEVVDWFIDEFKKLRPDLENVSQMVYNRILSADENYIPDVYRRIKEDKSMSTKIDEVKTAAFFDNADVVNKKEASVLMAKNNPQKLPQGRTLSSSFISDMFRKIEDAKTDINISSKISRLEAFIDNQTFKDSFENYKDYEILREKLVRSIAIAKNAQGSSNSEIKKYFDVISRVSSSLALGGATQVVKQVAPIVVNTAANTLNKSSLGLLVGDATAANELLSKSSVATRGLQSELDVDNKMKKLQSEFEKKGVSKSLDNVLDFYLKNFLEIPDVWIAKKSWMVYYADKLMTDGKINDVSEINWEEHGKNPDEAAMTHADNMVDRQQNVSMKELQGMMYSNNNESALLLRKIFLPFSTFVFNMKSRMWTDVNILTSDLRTEDEKWQAIRSLTGAAGEIAAFSGVSSLIGYMLSEAADFITDREEEDDESEQEWYEEYFFKSLATNAFIDIFSPFPPIDPYVKKGVNWAIEAMAGEGYDPKKNFSLIEYPEGQYGQFGIAFQKYSELAQFADMILGDSFTTEGFIGQDVEKELSDEDRKKVAAAAAAYMAYLSGVMPVEVGRLALKVRDRIVWNSENIKKGGSGRITNYQLKKISPAMYRIKKKQEERLKKMKKKYQEN